MLHPPQYGPSSAKGTEATQLLTNAHHAAAPGWAARAMSAPEKVQPQWLMHVHIDIPRYEKIRNRVMLVISQYFAETSAIGVDPLGSMG